MHFLLLVYCTPSLTGELVLYQKWREPHSWSWGPAETGTQTVSNISRRSVDINVRRMGRVTRPMFKQCFATLSDVQLCPPIKYLIQSMQLMSRGRKRILGGGQGFWKQKDEKS